jgi:hypothetical protein
VFRVTGQHFFLQFAFKKIYTLYHDYDMDFSLAV